MKITHIFIIILNIVYEFSLENLALTFASIYTALPITKEDSESHNFHVQGQNIQSYCLDILANHNVYAKLF